MCGIFCILFAEQVHARSFHSKHIEQLIKNRGPNSSKTVFRNGVLFHGAVLWQQGEKSCEQPVEFDEGLLLFNGDLYIETLKSYEKSDTEFLFEVLKQAKTEDEILEVLKSVTGPFSIIFMHESKVYFARDSLGRNSLILGKEKNAIFLTSVIDPGDAEIDALELPPLGIFTCDINTKEFFLFPYQDLVHQHHLDQLELLSNLIPVRILKNVKPMWQSESANLPDFSFDELCCDLNDENLYEDLLKLTTIAEISNTFSQLLSASIEDRIKNTQSFCKNCFNNKNCNHSNIGILFSGGVDCSLVAILADKFIDQNRPIDLMNIAFEKVSYSIKKPDTINWNVPDRLTGVETLKELKRLCPSRVWNFVEINVTRQELNENLPKLSSLVFPLSNVLDESLGAALYFASRGIGRIDDLPYSSPCRVILIGSGADELFGGYTRHRNAFRRSTADRDLLKEELDLDWVRLPSRNLARDDRVIGDNGITVRAPFIEERFVNFVQQLRPLQRCFPALAEGVGDKLLLRLSAHHIGLQNCSRFKKRALQFGSRIADKRQNAKDTSKLLTKNTK